MQQGSASTTNKQTDTNWNWTADLERPFATLHCHAAEALRDVCQLSQVELVVEFDCRERVAHSWLEFSWQTFCCLQHSQWHHLQSHDHALLLLFDLQPTC